jgi:protein-L-isoaspartate O-methyltransferase
MQGLFGGAREEENDEEEDSSRVREAIESTPRALFVPPEAALFANNDMPLDLHPYGLATNLSAPHIYPRVLQLLRVAPGMKVSYFFFSAKSDSRQVLDVGCGTGCLATMCLRLGGQVEGWDIDERVLDFARHVAARKGFPVW